MAKNKKEKVEFNVQTHGEDLKKSLGEAVTIMTKISLYRDSIKDIRDRCKEEMGLEPKKFNALLRLLYNQSKDEFEADTEELIELYDQVVDA